MGQISVKLDDSRIAELDREAEADGFASRADLVREAIESRGEMSEHERKMQDQLDELRSQLADLREENERLQRERRQILEQREENRELVAFADQQQSILERQEARRARPVWARAIRWVIGERIEQQQ